MLESNTRTVTAGSFECLFATEVLADRNELHFRCDDSPACVGELCNSSTIGALPRIPLQPRKRLVLHTALALRRMFKAEIAVVFRTNFPPFIFDSVAAVENPLQTKGRQPLPYVTHCRGVGPSTTCVVNADPRSVLCRDLA